MDDTGRQTGARRGQYPPRNGARRTGPQPGGNGRPGGGPDHGDGFEHGWFSKPAEPMAAPPMPSNGHRGAQSSARLPPVPPPRPQVPPPPPVNEPDFDQERFDNAFTDPGPFGRVPSAGTTSSGLHPVLPPADDDDLYDQLYGEDDRDEPRDQPADKETPRKRKKLPFWIELPVLILVALVFTFVIQSFVARVYVIPSGSMELTLNGSNGSGDRILVDKVVYDFHDPHPGDVVVFKGPPGWDQTEFFVDSSGNPVVKWLRGLAASIGVAKPDEYDLVKRVIAVGGQTVSCCDKQNRVIVDGKPLNEPYVYWQPGRPGPAEQLHFPPVTIPKGDLWVMGDNRANSDDSRYQNGGGIHGVVPVANVIGKARTIIWPPSRWRGIGDFDAQTQAVADAAPTWGTQVPATGIGVLAVLPTLWLGRRFRPGFRAAAGLPGRKRR
ncbi:MAG TPA: signal peptidase I [Pseudonocardiaceae bacterium]|nr:signal peptidase I [Pseudonocardiaceae bacterium]